MAIQMRRGLLSDFDPTKLLAGEWAVSIDPDTQNQCVYMCFASGVVKRMGTYDDFSALIYQATEDIRTRYLNDFKLLYDNREAILDQMITDEDAKHLAWYNEYQQLLTEIQTLHGEVVTCHSDIVDTYIPQILKALADAEQEALKSALSSQEAKEHKEKAEEWSLISEAWAVGQKNGIDVANTEIQYNNNSRYYASLSESASLTAKAYAEMSQKLLDEANKKAEVVKFNVNTVTGNLEYDSTTNQFTINTTTGNLEYSLII